MALPTRANVSNPRAGGYDFRIDEVYFRGSIAPDRPLDITTADLQAQKVNTANGSEDLRNEFGEIFSRSSFVGGEGLAFAHRRDLPDNAVSRYWDSTHIDISNPIPGQPAKITLLPVTASIETSAASNLSLAYDGTALYMGKALLPRRSTDFTDTTPTFADDSTGAAVTVLDLTTLGADVYAAQGANKIYKRTSGSGWAQLASGPTTQKVWGVKLLLLAATGSTGSILSEINTGTGAETARVTLPNGQAWLDAADCGKAILAAASDGSVYALTSVSGALTLQAQTPMPAGQVPYCIGFDNTYVFVGTREATPSGAIGRVYRMELQTTYELGNAVLLRQWGDQSSTVDHSPRKIVASRAGVVWGVYETGGSFLWRYDSASAGVSRHLDLGAAGLVVDVLSVRGRLFATVDAVGLRREKVGTYEASGYLMGPLGDLFSASQKSWAGALLDHEDITADSRIELYYATDPNALNDWTSPLWTLVKSVESGIDSDETPLTDVDDRFLAGMVKLYANTAATIAPSVRGFAFRAYPGAGDVELSMAINTSDDVTVPGRKILTSRGLGALVYDQLKGKEGRYGEVEVLSTSEIFRGVIEKVSTRMPMAATRGTPSVVTMVTFRGRRYVAPTVGVTTIIRGVAADRDLYTPAATYAASRVGTGVAFNNGASFDAIQVGQLGVSHEFAVYQSFIAFDTSAVVGTVISAVLTLTPLSIVATSGAFTVEARLKDWGATVGTDDWIAGASLDAATLLASHDSSMSADVPVDFTSDPDFVDNINVGGTTRMMLCSSQQRVGNAPADGTSGVATFHSGDAVTASVRPTLTIVSTG